MALDIKLYDDAVIRATLEALTKEYTGEHIFDTPGTRPICPIPAVQTGSIWLDRALGIGGIPKGRLTIIAGNESTGKSTLSLSIVKSQQTADSSKLNVYVDMEAGAFTDDYAEAMGVDLDPNRFLVVHPEYAEQGIVIIDRLISTGKVGVVVWDSIAGSFTKEAADNTAEESNSIASMARLLSEHLGKLANRCGRTGTALILVNQLRVQGIGSYTTWADITGGKAQKFYSSVRIDLMKDKQKDFSGNVDREAITAHISKNKVSIPYKEAKFDILLGKGIMKESNVLDVAGRMNSVTQLEAKAGGHFYFHDFRTGEEIAYVRGRQNAIDWLVENPDYTDQLEQAILGYQVSKEYTQEDIPEPLPEKIPEAEEIWEAVAEG